MKQITEAQIKQIMDTLMELNIPVKVFAGMQNLFAGLPVNETPSEKTPS